MKPALYLLIFLSAWLTGCAVAGPPAVEAIRTPQPDTLVQSTATGIPTLPPDSTVIFVPTNSPALNSVDIFPTASPDCNIAHLVAQGYLLDSGERINPGADITLIWRLTNIGTCTWVADYSVVLVENQGLEIQQFQDFYITAIPGQTVDLSIEVTLPEETGSYSAIWLLQNPKGDIFGHGQSAGQLFTLEITVGSQSSSLVINNWLFPAEVCSGQYTQNWLPRFARLMHDPQWMPWPSRMADPDWPSGFYFDWYPETVQLWTRPRGGDGRLPYNLDWLGYLRTIQPSNSAAVWIARIAAGLFNPGNEFIPILNLDQLKVQPIAESISSGGNVVRVLEILNLSARIDMLYYKYSPPDPRQVNYQTRPWLVTKFTSISIDGELGNAGGIDVYFPNLAKQEDGYWVDMQRVEFFPDLPFCAKVNTNTTVLDEPTATGKSVGILASGQKMLIREYLPQGSDVWGRIKEGWILLLFQIDGQPIYPTSWSMETRPPIVLP